MKSTSRGKYIAKGLFFGLIAASVFTLALMLLWNWLMPTIFGLGLLTFWQALGVLLLSKILFGGAHHPHSRWQDREQNKMRREQFQERFRKVHSMYHPKGTNDETTAVEQ